MWMQGVTKCVVGVDGGLGCGGEGFDQSYAEVVWEAVVEVVLDVEQGAKEVAGKVLDRKLWMYSPKRGELVEKEPPPGGGSW